jgi:pyrroline-5-carboxylate reductase
LGERFGVVGLGRMAQALLLPLMESGLVQRSAVRAAVASAASAERLAAEHGLMVSTDPSEAWAASTVLLAVKPQQLEAVAAQGVAAQAAAAQGVAAQGVAAQGVAVQAAAVQGVAHGAAQATAVQEKAIQESAIQGRGITTRPEPLTHPPASGGSASDPDTGAAATAPPSSERLLISVLAGVSLERLGRLFPGWRCVRAVPNTPCLVRQGLTGLAWGEGINPEQREQVRQLFALVGAVHELPESQLDAFLALTSSGPAFVALVAEAMADGAVAAGLPRALALELAQRTLAGTAALLEERQLHPALLKDMVSSPAGTTIAGLRQLERAGLRSALLEAVLAAAERSRELGAAGVAQPPGSAASRHGGSSEGSGSASPR